MINPMIMGMNHASVGLSGFNIPGVGPFHSINPMVNQANHQRKLDNSTEKKEQEKITKI